MTKTSPGRNVPDGSGMPIKAVLLGSMNLMTLFQAVNFGDFLDQLVLGIRVVAKIGPTLQHLQDDFGRVLWKSH